MVNRRASAVSNHKGAYAKWIELLPAHARSPFEVQSGVFKPTDSVTLAMLGSVAAARADFAEAKAWFRHAYLMNEESVRMRAARLQSWPARAAPQDQKLARVQEILCFDLGYGSILARLAQERIEETRTLEFYRKALGWQRAWWNDNFAGLLNLKPALSNYGPANLLAFELIFTFALPAVILNEEEQVDASLEWSKIALDWHRRIGRFDEELAAKKFMSHSLLGAFKGLVEGDADGFCENLGKSASVELRNANDPTTHPSGCLYEYFAMYLQGWDRIGSLPRCDLVGVPPLDGPETYWRA